MALGHNSNLLDLTQQELGYNIPLEQVKEYTKLVRDYSQLYSLPLHKLELRFIWNYRTVLKDAHLRDEQQIEADIRKFFSDYLWERGV